MRKARVQWMHIVLIPLDLTIANVNQGILSMAHIVLIIMNAGANVINVTSTHGASTLRAHINVSVEKGIMGMDLNVKEKVYLSPRTTEKGCVRPCISKRYKTE